MPEYSSTTITPADGVQVPSMNGSTSGNFLLSALKSYILAAAGQANGLATLGSDGKLTAAQVPDSLDDVIVVASYAVLPATGTAGKIYITADNNKMYRWDPDLETPDYVELSVDLSAYAKLTDLAAETAAREAADSNLNDALTQLDHRVENLEQAKGDYVVNTYKDGAITPSGKGDWSIVEGLRGVSRVENNLVDYTKETSYNASVSVSGTEISSTTSVNGGYFGFTSFPVVNGHSYLIAFNVKTKASSSIVLRFLGTNGWIVSEVGRPSQGQNTYLITPSVNDNNGQLYWYGEVGKTDIYDNFIYTDLTLYFGGTIPSDADTIAEIQTNYPELLQPSEYGTRIVDAGYAGVESGIDLVNGSIDGSGNDTPSDSRVRSSFVPVSGSITLAIDNPSAGQIITEAHYYNSAKTWLSYEAVSNTSKTLTIPSSCKYLKFILRNSNQTITTPSEWYGKLLINNVHIERFLGALSLTFTGKSARAVADTCEPNVEVNGVAKKRETERVGSAQLEELTGWSYQNTFSYTDALASVVKKPASNNDVADILSAKYLPSPRNSSHDGNVCVQSDGRLVVFSTDNPPSGTLYYALAEESVTLSDPLIDNTLLTEAGGRMATVQTGTVVDGSFDLGFITL